MFMRLRIRACARAVYERLRACRFCRDFLAVRGSSGHFEAPDLYKIEWMSWKKGVLET